MTVAIPTLTPRPRVAPMRRAIEKENAYDRANIRTGSSTARKMRRATIRAFSRPASTSIANCKTITPATTPIPSKGRLAAGALAEADPLSVTLSAGEAVAAGEAPDTLAFIIAALTYIARGPSAPLSVGLWTGLVGVLVQFVACGAADNGAQRIVRSGKNDATSPICWPSRPRCARRGLPHYGGARRQARHGRRSEARGSGSPPAH